MRVDISFTLSVEDSCAADLRGWDRRKKRFVELGS
jgi:hypothetical protein